MDLAFVTGHGPALLTEFEGRAPLIRESDAVAFGFRDAEDQAAYGSQPLPAELRSFDLPARECVVEVRFLMPFDDSNSGRLPKRRGDGPPRRDFAPILCKAMSSAGVS